MTLLIFFTSLFLFITTVTCVPNISKNSGVSKRNSNTSNIESDWSGSSSNVNIKEYVETNIGSVKKHGRTNKFKNTKNGKKYR